MDALDPIINLLTLLTALSVVAERITNVIKERRDLKLSAAESEKERDYAVHGRAVCVGIALALIIKADFFAFVVHIQDPWSTIGWVRVEGEQWYRSPALRSLGGFLYAVGGCVLTGWALGFGSKFWHDVLGIINELKNARKGDADRDPETAPGGSTLDPKPRGSEE